MRRLLAGVALALLPAYPVLAQEAEERPITVEVSQLSEVLRPDGSLVIRGSFVNRGDAAVRDLQVRLYVGARIETRSELADIAGDPGRASTGQVTRVPIPGDNDVGQTPLPFALDVPADDVAGLGNRAGVHPLRIEVRGRVGDRSALRAVGAADTFLQWWPSGRAQSRLAWVWPLVETDDRDVDGVYADESLAESVAPDGRLEELLAVAEDVSTKTPVTWAVDPALVASVTDLADGYEVRTPDGEAPGRGADAAKRWLEDLDTALSKRQSPVLALPYADPDVVALVRSGHADRIGGMLRDGRQVLQQRLGVTADPRLAWPPDGLVDSATLDVLAADGIRSVVVADETFTVTDETNYTPSAAAGLGAEGGTALVADATLARIVAEGADGDGDRLDVQRFLAETALITLERPSLRRDIVVAPPRTWAPLPGYARQLLELSAGVPWLTPTTLPQVAEGEPAVSGYVSYPQEAAARELSPEYLGRVFAQRERLARFRSILDRDSDHPLLLLGGETLDRAVSANRRGEIGPATALVDSVRRRLDGEFGQIRVITGGVVTLTSETGRIPLTIENRLDEDVLLRVTIDTRGRLLLDQNRPVEMRFPRGSKTQLTIDCRAVQAGEFTIAVQLLTPDGDPLPGGTATLRVRSTAYGNVALVITVGAFGVLLVASATRLVRRRRRSAAAAATA